jgi:hypothetical protein
MQETMETNISMPRRSNAGKVFTGILFLLLLVSAAAAVYFYRQLSVYKQNPQKVVQEEVQVVVNKVAQLMVLPEGEQPTLATVADLAQLRNQPFFAQAKVGDKVLFYANAKKAILYNPEANKIVEVAPLNLGDNNQPAQSVPPAPQPEQTTETNPAQ